MHYPGDKLFISDQLGQRIRIMLHVSRDAVFVVQLYRVTKCGFDLSKMKFFEEKF
jgi:hypothetical protein